MSLYNRRLTRNFHLSLGKVPVLNNYILFNDFPIGLIILSRNDFISCRNDTESNKGSVYSEDSEIKIRYINPQASELFELKENDNMTKIHDQFKKFQKFDKNQVIEKTLDNILFNSNRETEYYGFFKNKISLIYVKYKISNEDIYLCADYYTDERKIIQSQLFQSLKFQYIATLFHELYNPINALLFMIDTNKQENKSSIINSNIDDNSSELEDSDSSELSGDKSSVNKNNMNKKNTKYAKLYKQKLSALNEKEKDISLLVNMIYIFLQNLILYFRINLGVDFKVNKTNKQENNEKENSKINNNKQEEEISEAQKGNIYSDKYLSIINKNKKLNLEFSFHKQFDKFSYLFNFKNINYCNNFSYLSDKFILTDESIFFDFLGQLYSFLYYVVPKSKGFELSYSIINDNKLKILFLKTNYPKTRGYRMKKSRKSFSCVLGDGIFEATNTVKTSEMIQEILYKLSEILGIKLKIMEYEEQKEDKYLTIIMPFFKDSDKNLITPEINILSEDVLKKKNNQLLGIKTIESNENNQNVNYQKQLSSFSGSKSPINKNVNYLNPNFFKFAPERKASYLVEEVEERNPSEEDLSSKKDSELRENSKDNSKLSVISINKSPKNNNSLSIISNSKNNSLFGKSKSPTNKKHCFGNKMSNFNELSNNYLKEINPIFSKKETNASKNFKSNTNASNNKNPLILIHQKYSQIERLKASGVEILQEKESKKDNLNRNKSFILEPVNSNNENNLNDKKSITAEIDSDNYIEIENEDDIIENEIINNTNIINQSQNDFKHNNTALFNIAYINNKPSFNCSSNENLYQDIRKKKNKRGSKKHSNKTLDCNKGTNDNLFHIQPQLNRKVKKLNSKIELNTNPISLLGCNCKDILLVDDDEFILKTSKIILKHFKLEADCAENGQECLNMIKTKQQKDCNCSKNKYKIILMDITMPVMDGIEAAKNIQKLIDENKLYDTIKIIFISAHVNLDLKSILTGIKCAVDYYAKPISKDKYKSILDKYYYSE